VCSEPSVNACDMEDVGAVRQQPQPLAFAKLPQAHSAIRVLLVATFLYLLPELNRGEGVDHSGSQADALDLRWSLDENVLVGTTLSSRVSPKLPPPAGPSSKG